MRWELRFSVRPICKTFIRWALALTCQALPVDGMDVVAIYSIAMDEAVQRARAGEGPTFLEIRTYRYKGHSNISDPAKYRTKEELAAYKERRSDYGCKACYSRR